MPIYTRHNFLREFPDFQENSVANLQCSFDEAGFLSEASYHLDSKAFEKRIKFMTLKIEKERVEIERGSLIDFYDWTSPIKLTFRTEEWKGAKGSYKIIDKDQNETQVEWTRDRKIREALLEMLDLSAHYKLKSDKEEVEEYRASTNEILQREATYAQGNFRNWPRNLTEARFKTWRDLTPEFGPKEFGMFFDWLEENKHDLAGLSQDELGALLSMYISKMLK